MTDGSLPLRERGSRDHPLGRRQTDDIHGHMLLDGCSFIFFSVFIVIRNFLAVDATRVSCR